MTKFTKALSVIITLWGLLFLANPAFSQGGNIGSVSSPVTNRNGQPIGGVHISFCQPLGVSSAAVTSNVAILTMSSNPITAGFVAGRTILVNGFTAGDTYFNGGILTNGVITSGYTILSVTTTTITYSLAHANAASATVGAVLQQGSTTVSCAGLSSVYSNPTLVTAATNPTTSDNQGNWNVFAAPGLYYVQFYGTGITTTLKQIAIACVPSGTCTTLSPLVIPGITSGGLSVTSPPIGGSAALQLGVTGNGTAQATFPAANDTVLELTQTQSPTNKTLTIGNNVTLLNAQLVQAPITGTGAAAVLYTYTMPASTLLASKGIRLRVYAKHTTGVAATTFTMTFGGTTITQGGGVAGAANATVVQVLDIYNNSGSTTAQTLGTTINDGNSGGQFSFSGLTAAENTANPIIITSKFNVANTDAWTPEIFTVEAIQ